MARAKGKAGNKAKGRAKKLSVKKQPIESPDVPKEKGAKSAAVTPAGKATPILMKK